MHMPNQRLLSGGGWLAGCATGGTGGGVSVWRVWGVWGMAIRGDGWQIVYVTFGKQKNAKRGSLAFFITEYKIKPTTVWKYLSSANHNFA